MRIYMLMALVLASTLAGCYSRTIEKPVVVQPQSSDAVVVPPGSTAVVTP